MARTVLKSQARFINPFSGRAKAIELSGLFLFDPIVEVKLGGNPLRGLFVEMDKESLYKRLERSAKLGVPWSKRLSNEVFELLPPQMHEEMRAMLAGDESIAQREGIVGLWTCYFYMTRSLMGNPLDSHEQWTMDIERACVDAATLCDRGEFAGAARLLANDPLMRHFLWPAALEAIEKSPSRQGLHPVRAAVALEVRLSIMACWDVQLQVAAGNVETANFACLLPSPNSKAKNAIGLFFRWLLEKAGVSTITALSEDVRLAGVSVDIGTLGAWSRGTNLPIWSYLKVISVALFGVVETEETQRMYWAATYFNFVGYYAESIVSLVGKMETTTAALALAPWPTFPFGHDSIESWFGSRYQYWLEFHRRSCRE
jgi:hypothetical protein